MSKQTCKIQLTKDKKTTTGVFELTDNTFATQKFVESFVRYAMDPLVGDEKPGLNMDEICKRLDHVSNFLKGKRYTLLGISEVVEGNEKQLTVHYREKHPS